MKKTLSIIIVLALNTAASVANADYTFGTPINMGPTLNSSAADECQFASSDGLELYFSSYRSGGYGHLDLYISTRETTQDPWGAPVNMGPRFNTSGLDGTPCLSADDLELYFYSDRPGVAEGSYIWISRRASKDDEWGEPMNFGPIFNSGAKEISPSLSSDGLELYFSNYQTLPVGGYGKGDIWMISRPSISDPWSQPMNLGPIVNSASDDGIPALSTDGRMLFFMSSRSGGQGGYDLWLTKRATPDDDWGEPVNLGPRINTAWTDADPAISADGRTLYYMSGLTYGFTGWEMWQVPIDPVVDLDGNGRVDKADMCMLVDAWGTDDPLCDIGPMPWGDGIVDVNDLIVLGEHLFEVLGPGDNVIERRVSAGNDDAEEALNPGNNNWNKSKILRLVDDNQYNGGRQLVGLTFRDIDIAPGEKINEAYIEFYCVDRRDGTEDAYLLIWGHLTPDSEGFVVPFVISNRPQTAAKVPWEPDTWDAEGQTIQTVNIAPIIQELIDQPGWVSGNAVEIIIGADPDKPAFTGVRSANSFNFWQPYAPLLHIEMDVP